MLVQDELVVLTLVQEKLETERELAGDCAGPPNKEGERKLMQDLSRSEKEMFQGQVHYTALLSSNEGT